MCSDVLQACVDTNLNNLDFNDQQYDKNFTNNTATPDYALEYLYPQDKTIFFSIYLLLYVISFFGNIAAIAVTFTRNQRCIQKACIISLALSDLIAASSLVTMSMNTFCQRLILWKLGPLLCSLLPSVPVFGIICSSVALVGIALDRYHNVICAFKKRWNPSALACISIVSILWSSAACLSYPMYTFFTHESINVVFYDHTNTVPLYYETHFICITFKKKILSYYYITVICVIFVPLLLLFFWLYYRIARLVWEHRKPPSSHFNKSETSNVAETSTTQTRVSEDTSKSMANSDTILKSAKKRKNIRIERKIRTFKIIVSLMCIFVILRLPIWIFDIIKLSITMDGHASWVIKYITTALTLLSCSLNPFLYTFLNKTLEVFTQIVRTLNEFVCQVCCCCFSDSEFQEFENENPFINKSFEGIMHKNDQKVLTDSSIKGSRVRFELPDVIEPKGSSEEIKKY